MPESGDILKYLDSQVSSPTTIGALRADIKAFLSGPFKDAQRTLCRPILHGGGLTHVPDYAKPEDLAYAREKYIAAGFDYEAAQKPETQKKARAEMGAQLVALQSLMQSE